MNSSQKIAYSPGKCNIGPKEIRKRYAIGFLGFITAIILIVLFSFFKLNYLFFIILLLPFLLGFVGFYQGYTKFCVGNAMEGIYDLSDTKSKRGVIKNRIAHSLDLKKAVILIAYSVISAAIITFIITFIAYYTGV